MNPVRYLLNLVTKSLIPSCLGVISTGSCCSLVNCCVTASTVRYNFTVNLSTPTFSIEYWSIDNQHIKDFQVDFHRHILAQQSGKFSFGINAVISIQVLSQFWSPDSFQLTSLSYDRFALQLKVDSCLDSRIGSGLECL